MSTYTRAPLGFKEHLAAIADHSYSERISRADRHPQLNLKHLADELRENLSPVQRGSLCAALLRYGAGLPAVISRSESVLSTEQKRAVLALCIVNEIEFISRFFSESEGSDRDI